MTLEVEDEKKEVELFGKVQDQNLDFEVTMESQDGCLVVTLQCQIVKGICKVDSTVLPR